MFAYRGWGWLVVAGCLLVSAAGRQARAQSAIGLDFGLFLDDISLEDDERIGTLHQIVRQDRDNKNIAEGAIYYLHHVGPADDEERLAGFRLGGEFRYLGSYVTELSDGDAQRQEMGTLIEFGFRGDWTAIIVHDFGVVVGLRFDMAMLFPGGDFADEIERLKDEGVPTSSGPRLGLALLPSVGARYALHERFNVRFDVGLGWSYLDLLSIDAGVQGIQYVRDTSISSRRFEVSLGVEIVL
jgi:hypothetical protein